MAGGLALFGTLDVLLSPDWRGPDAVNAVVVPGMALMLIWRRKRPLLALAGVMGGFVFLALAFGSSETYSFLFIGAVAVYSAAAHGSNLPLMIAIIAGSITVQTLNDPQIESFGDAIWGPTFAALIFLAGWKSVV